jgi:putative transposase
MIDRTHALPVKRQAEVLKLSRSSVYYRPRPVSPADLSIMRRIVRVRCRPPYWEGPRVRDMRPLIGELAGIHDDSNGSLWP